MASELVEGKRTFIARRGRQPYEIPDEHSARWGDGRDEIHLEVPQVAGGLYSVDEIEEGDDTIVVWVGAMIAGAGPSGLSSPIGYPFLD
jgi:hypothetical protein